MRPLLLSWCSIGMFAACGNVVGPPEGEVSISPRMPRTMDDLVATATSDDDRLSFQWSKNGAVRSDLAGPTVDAALTTKNEVWRVDLMTDEGDSISSDEVTILNTAPATPTLSFTPAGLLFVNEPIVCVVTAADPDPDGDPINYLASWTKNGTLLAGATTTTFMGDTVPAAAVALNDVFVCIVTASDGADASVAAMATATATCLATAGTSVVLAANGTPPSGTIQMFTVPPNVCRLTIEAAGGEGGTNQAAGSTNGARMIGTFPVTPGTALQVLVGQAAGGPSRYSGGGGTFVVAPGNIPLIIAGGGGANFAGTIPLAESVGRIETSGGTSGGALRADAGQGGTIIAGANVGGGGGFLTDGGGLGGGKSFMNGGAGGGTEQQGGYGGGGGRTGLFGEGAGGGYSGGSCGNTASAWSGCGGGGSLNTGTNQVNTAGAITGNGYVRFTW